MVFINIWHPAQQQWVLSGLINFLLLCQLPIYVWFALPFILPIQKFSFLFNQGSCRHWLHIYSPRNNSKYWASSCYAGQTCPP